MSVASAARVLYRRSSAREFTNLPPESKVNGGFEPSPAVVEPASMSFLRALPTLVVLVVAACSEPGQTEIARGNVLASQKRYDEALAAYRAAGAAQPRCAHPRELAGHLLFDLRRYGEARRAYEEAEGLEPNDALEARIGLARLDAEEQRLDDALAGLNVILEKRPDNLYALLSRATVALRRNRPGDLETAISDTAKAMAIDSKSGAVLYARGSAFIAAKEYEQAAQAFALLQRAHPRSPLAFYGYARLASIREDRAGALANLRRARNAAEDQLGGWNPRQVRADPAFARLKDDPEFVEIVDSRLAR